jgi:hypothetical protein
MIHPGAVTQRHLHRPLAFPMMARDNDRSRCGELPLQREVQRWLQPRKRRRFHFHFTPTSSSWLNQVERFFALITGRMIRRGTFHSAEELEQAIYQWLAKCNGAPTPFVWKASAAVILDKVRRCKELSNTGD